MAARSQEGHVSLREFFLGNKERRIPHLPGRIFAFPSGLRRIPRAEEADSQHPQPPIDPAADTPSDVPSSAPSGPQEHSNVPENPHNGVTVEVKRLEELKQAIIADDPYTFARENVIKKVTLKDPLSDARIYWKTDNDTYDFFAELNMPSSLGNPRDGTWQYIDSDDGREKFLKVFSYKFEDSEKRGNSIVVKGPNGKRMVIGFSEETFGKHKLNITTGPLPGRYSFDDKQIIDSPSREDTPERDQNMNATIIDFAAVLEKTINEFYGMDPSVKLPSDTIVISGPIPAGEEHTYIPPRSQTPDVPTSFKDPSPVSPSKIKLEKSALGQYTIEQPNVSFDEIGGHKDAKRELKGIAYAIKNQDRFLDRGTDPTQGILLYGPPGTGKTELVRALATNTEAAFIRLSASDLFRKWLGESEQIIKTVFNAAKNAEGPVIMFVDELDTIASSRDNDSNKAYDAIIGELLTQLQGIEGHKNVIFVAASNRLESIDPAIVRAGRIDQVIEVGLPKTAEDIAEITQIHINKINDRAFKREMTSPFADLDLIAIVQAIQERKDLNVSGADIKEIIRHAIFDQTLDDIINEEEEAARLDKRIEEIEQRNTLVTTERILREIDKYRRKTNGKRPGFMGFNPADAMEARLLAMGFDVKKDGWTSAAIDARDRIVQGRR